MKFIYEGDGARTFRGYFFWNRNPVDVTDRATLAALEREADFRRVEDEKETRKDAHEEKVLKGCPKCGKVFERGQHLHNRYCKA